MNRFLKTALASVFALSFAASCFAAGSLVSINVDPSIKILVNGEIFSPKDANGNDVMTFTYNGTTYAPLRAMAEAFGLEVGYDADRRMATVGEYSAQSPNSFAGEEYGEGHYKVGVDIPAGVYMLWTNSSYDGYFMYSSDANGDDIIKNDSFSTNSIIEILPGEYLTLRRCSAVAIDDSVRPRSSGGYFGEGFYVIGTDIPAGEYKLTATNPDYSGYYCIYNNARRDNIVNNESFSNSQYVHLEDGQYLKLSRCKIRVN